MAEKLERSVRTINNMLGVGSLTFYLTSKPETVAIMMSFVWIVDPFFQGLSDGLTERWFGDSL